MDNNRIIAKGRIDGLGMVHILRISSNEVIKCNRNCASLQESEDGSIQCSIGWIKKMVNFQTTALVIDYEIVLSKDAEEEWDVGPYDFTVIDTEGQIYRGEFICHDIVSPKGLSMGIRQLYPGTKGKFRVYYDTFPKDGTIASIIVDRSSAYKVRIELAPPVIHEDGFEDESAQSPSVPQEQRDLRQRVESLEKQISRLRMDFDSLRLTLASKDVIPYKHKEKPMSDPGIEYHPLDKK